jgi:AcrR family transcriptional regulator
MAIDTEPHRRRRDAERNHERILAAAGDCFAEVGADAQMADIARRAGVGVGTVYRAFSTKEALAVAIATSCLAKLADAARLAATDGDAWRGFSGFVEQAVTAVDGARPFSGLVKQRVADTELAEALAEVGRAVCELTAHAQAAGVVRRDLSPQVIAASLRATVMAARGGTCTSSPGFDAAAHARIFLDGLRSTPA